MNATEQQKIKELEADLANVRSERQQYKELCQKEQAKCAEMRKCIVALVSGLHHKALNDPAMQATIDHALSSDCGKNRGEV